jgi:hypothetical protein
MASSPEAAALTEAHRLAQIRIAAQAIARTDALWGLLDLNDLDGTFPRWSRAVAQVVATDGQRSAATAANYCTAHRRIELGRSAAAFTPRLVPAAIGAVPTSLLIEGPARIRSGLARGRPLELLARTARAETAAAAARHVNGAGRNTIIRAVADDRQALGWARATSGNCCSFCAMLASRGPIYKAERTAEFEPHNRCGCTAEIVYREDADWPPGSRRFQELWQETTRGRNGQDAVIAFRQAIEGRA